MIGDDLHLARLTPEFRELGALLGYFPKRTESWAPWALLVEQHGWKRLLRAARQLQGQEGVFPRDYARLCQRYAKEEAEASVPVESHTKPPSAEERQAQAARFRKMRDEVRNT